MKGMNLSRVLLGGLVAGIIINVGESVLNLVVLGDRVDAMLAQAGGGLTSWAMPALLAAAFGWGILFVGAYAAIRPRFGAGWQTAAIAGTTMWAAASLIPGLVSLATGVGDPAIMMIGWTWALVEFNVATIAGAWLYREAVADVRAADPVRAPMM